MLINPTKLTRSPIATLLKLPALMAEHLVSAQDLVFCGGTGICLH